MDKLIERILDGELFWCEAASALRNQKTAFSPYSNQPRSSTPTSDIGLNMNKRVIEFLRKSRPPATSRHPAGGGERSFRHMMNERLRRGKQKTSYAALHSALPAGTKSDKNSIVESAVQSIEELQLVKAELEKRNRELLEGTASSTRPPPPLQATKLKIRVPNPASGIDSFIAVLKFLKNYGSETRAVQAELTDQEFVATLYVQTTHQNGVAEMENGVQRALHEAELQLPSSPSAFITST